MRSYGLQSLWALPLEVTIRGVMTQGLLGPVFLAAPLGLLALRNREGRKMLVPCALLLAVYFGNIGTRFLIPSLPFVSLAMALALEAAAPVLALLIIFQAASSWPSVLKTNVWAVPSVPPYRAALRIIPEEQFLSSHSKYQWARMVERNVPRGKLVFTFTGLADSYTTREVLIGYWGALNNDVSDELSEGWIKDWQPNRLSIFFLPAQKYRRLRVVQTGTASTFREEQWNIHEMRFFHAGSELPRRPDWRLQASPNPWGVQMAFDNSEATRWKSWETLRPGMWMAVDFGREEPVDQVQVELSGDEWDVQMHVETTDAMGHWIPLAARTEERRIKYSGSIRRAATYEAHLQGIDYFLIKDDDWGAKDFAEDPAGWGWTLLEHAYGASLYRVNP